MCHFNVFFLLWPRVTPNSPSAGQTLRYVNLIIKAEIIDPAWREMFTVWARLRTTATESERAVRNKDLFGNKS